MVFSHPYNALDEAKFPSSYRQMCHLCYTTQFRSNSDIIVTNTPLFIHMGVVVTWDDLRLRLGRGK